MIYWLIKIILFILSFLGYIWLIHFLYPKMNSHFIPIVVLSAFSILLFFLCLIKIVFVFKVVLYIIGLCLSVFSFIYNLKLKNRENKICIINRDMIFILIIFLFLCVLLYGHRFEWWDSYSHWGIMVKRMLLTNSFPDNNDKSIQYVSYPPSVSLLIYYFCSFVDSNDYTMAACLIMITLFSLYTFLFLAEKKGFIYHIVIILLLAGFFIYNYAPTDIMVDEQLSTVGAAGILYIICHKENLNEYKMVLPLCLLVSFESLIKSSGIYFSIITVLYYVIFNKVEKRKFAFVLSLLIIPLAIWGIHVKVAFPRLDYSNHAVSISRYLRVFKTRNNNEILKLVRVYSRSFFQSYHILLFFIFLVILSLLLYRIKKNNNIDDRVLEIRVFLSKVLFFFICYIVWALFLFGMYLFSLEDGDVLELPSFGRYMGSASLFVIIILETEFINSGLLDFFIERKYMKKTRLEYLFALLICLYFVVSQIVPTFIGFDLFEKGNMVSPHFRDKCYSIKFDYDMPDDAKCLVFDGYFYDPHTKSEDAKLRPGETYVFQYVFNTGDFIFVDLENYKRLKDDYDYLIITCDNTYLTKQLFEYLEVDYMINEDIKVLKLE